MRCRNGSARHFDTAASAGGDYTYRFTLDLAGFDPATAFIEGQLGYRQRGA